IEKSLKTSFQCLLSLITMRTSKYVMPKKIPNNIIIAIRYSNSVENGTTTLPSADLSCTKVINEPINNSKPIVPATIETSYGRPTDRPGESNASLKNEKTPLKYVFAFSFP